MIETEWNQLYKSMLSLAKSKESLHSWQIYTHVMRTSNINVLKPSLTVLASLLSL